MHNSIGNPNQSPVRITATTAVRDFLLAVVPWPATKADGFITIHWHRPGMDFLGRSCRTIDEALQIITQLNGFDVYFCLSRQRDGRGKRSHANATGMQAIWTDADVDPDNPKCYASHEEAINAILDFCRQANSRTVADCRFRWRSACVLAFRSNPVGRRMATIRRCADECDPACWP